MLSSLSLLDEVRTSLRGVNKFNNESCGRTNLDKSSSDLACLNEADAGQNVSTSDDQLHMTDILPGQFTSHVVLYCRLANNYNTRCSGIIINDNLILTKVDCLDKHKYCTVLTGLFTPNNLKGIQEHWVRGYCKLPKYHKSRDGSTSNDAALALLYRPIQLDEFTQPACIDRRREVRPGRSCVALGNTGEKMDEVLYRKTSLFGFVLRKSTDCSGAIYKRSSSTTSTCYETIKTKDTDGRRLCDDDLGTGLYCLDKCEGKRRNFVVGLMTHKGSKAQDCTLKEGGKVVFSEISKLGSDFDDMLNYCQEIEGLR